MELTRRTIRIMQWSLKTHKAITESLYCYNEVETGIIGPSHLFCSTRIQKIYDKIVEKKSVTIEM